MYRFSYPAHLEEDEGGFFLVTFPDVPEALTDGRDETEAREEALDALLAALGGYVEARRPIPAPGIHPQAAFIVDLPPLVAAKLALYETMREKRVTNVELGKRLKLSEGAVRRLLDLDHRSHIGQVEKALEILGKRLVIDLRAA